MIVLELFAGTRSIGKAFEKRGHEVYSIDWDYSFEDIDWYADISKISAIDIIARCRRPDVIWASPDCTTYSIAAISKHRRKDEISGELIPISDYAKFCDILNEHVLDLIRELEPKYWFIENPRGGLRTMKFMRDLPRYTVTYCQYGDTRMKPTDIWTNHPNPKFLPPCKNGASCHESSPRGETVQKFRKLGIELHKGGTSKLKNHKEQARIPELLCNHIVEICEEDYQ